MRIRWENYQTTKFEPFIEETTYEPLGSCGVNALSCVTGLTQRYIDRFTPKKKWWGDEEMLKFLKSRGYEAHPISEETIHEHKDYSWSEDYYRNSINHLNVLLISQHTKADEGSWFVVYNNTYHHGVERAFFSGYELISNPFWTGYALWHKKWKTTSEELTEAMRMALGFTDLNRKKINFYDPLRNSWGEVPLKRKTVSQLNSLYKSIGSK